MNEPVCHCQGSLCQVVVRPSAGQGNRRLASRVPLNYFEVSSQMLSNQGWGFPIECFYRVVSSSPTQTAKDVNPILSFLALRFNAFLFEAMGIGTNVYQVGIVHVLPPTGTN